MKRSGKNSGIVFYKIGLENNIVIGRNINGYVIKEKDSQDLIDKIELFLKKKPEERKQMGLAGRRKVEKTFDRKIVIEKYLNEVKNLGCK